MSTAQDTLNTMLSGLTSQASAPSEPAPVRKRRKRGGLAGVWDRNKHIIKPVATIAGQMVGIPAPASMALMEGFDRPGKGGVGFDVKRGAVGAAKGYAIGRLGDMFEAGYRANSGAGLNGIAGGIKNVAGSVGDAATRFGRPVIDWAAKNPTAAGMGLSAGANYLSAAQNRAMDQERFDFDRATVNRSWQERQRLMELLRPLFIQMTSRMGGGA